MATLITGNAGFIGFHVARRLLERGTEVVGFDCVNDYYEPSLKTSRLELLDEVASRTGTAYRFVHGDLADRPAVERLFSTNVFEQVVHLAAQAGVRYSLSNPHAYVESNVRGLVNLLEACRARRPAHFVFASSSSVYGLNAALPFSEHHGADHPVSLYAATKRSGELIAHAYSHLFGLPVTGLRFFTVYGPWGRPDMAYFSFAKAIVAGRPIEVFERGEMERDFTYVDDVVESIVRIADRPARSHPAWDPHHPDPALSSAPYRLYNIGNHSPVKVKHLISVLESALGRKAQIVFKPAQPGEVQATAADVTDLARDVDFTPRTTLETGLDRFARWYRDYYKV